MRPAPYRLTRMSDAGENGKSGQAREATTLLLMNREIRRISKDGWDEQRIDGHRTSGGSGHEGKILDSRADERTWVELKHIVASGLLKPGTRLKPGPGTWPATEAVVTRDGALRRCRRKEVSDRSGAGGCAEGAVDQRGRPGPWSRHHLRVAVDAEARFWVV